MIVRALKPADREWARGVLTAAWAAPSIVSRGRLIDASALPGLVAEIDGARAALLAYRIEDGECEIVSLNSEIERRGAASALVARVREIAREAGCRRVWLNTTNDNLPALRFYQKRGFALVAVRPNAMAEGRRLKPSIPLLGLDGIPIRDEIELEIAL
jgi:ribosomal protein S18 acetylase RimI-like enzyme